MTKKLILVDKHDKPIGEVTKIDAHLGNAKRHRAMTVIIKNDKGQILMTQRALQKPLWPTYWDFSYSSHPWVGESLEATCLRRAEEELGIPMSSWPDTKQSGPGSSPFKNVFSYEYHIRWSEVFSEWEINHILITTIDAGRNLPFTFNPEEIADHKWLTWPQVLNLSNQQKELFAPWTLIAIKKLTQTNYLNQHIYAN